MGMKFKLSHFLYLVGWSALVLAVGWGWGRHSMAEKQKRLKQEYEQEILLIDSIIAVNDSLIQNYTKMVKDMDRKIAKIVKESSRRGKDYYAIKPKGELEEIVKSLRQISETHRK